MAQRAADDESLRQGRQHASPQQYLPAVALTSLYGVVWSGNQPFRRKDNGQREQQAKRGDKKHQTVLHDQTLWGRHRHVMPVRQQTETPDRGSSHGQAEQDQDPEPLAVDHFALPMAFLSGIGLGKPMPTVSAKASRASSSTDTLCM